MGINEIEKKVLDTFSDIASGIGYSPVNGRIIGALLVAGKPLSMNQISRTAGCSPGMVSISMDLLDVLGVIKKLRRPGDRQVYAELHGDLLECLKKAFVMKLEKSTAGSLREFAESKAALESLPAGPERDSALRTIGVLEGQIRRLEKYTKMLAGIKLP